jgi:hypothetical protein
MITKFNKEAVIFTLETASGKRVWQNSGVSIRVFLQPVSEKDFMQTDGDPMETRKAYFQGQGVKQTDRLWIDGETYDVRSVVDFDFGTQKFKKIILSKSK